MGFAKSFTDFRKEIIVKLHHLIGRSVSRKEPLGLVGFRKAQALNIESFFTVGMRSSLGVLGGGGGEILSMNF